MPEIPALVLVVDDVPDMRELLRIRLELAGFTVATAANGREALELARRLDPTAVILDLEMPVMGGREALPLLRAIDPNMRILVHTAEDLDDAELTGSHKPDAILPKGSPFPKLVATINELRREWSENLVHLEVPAIPLQQAIHAFDSWLGLNARIRESDLTDAQGEHLPGLDPLTRIFFELGLQMLHAAQRHAEVVVLSMWVKRSSAEAALLALESIRATGFDSFYRSWGYVPVPEAAAALSDLSERLTESLAIVTKRGETG
jgi:CheY-like chemotaxis protein